MTTQTFTTCKTKKCEADTTSDSNYCKKHLFQVRYNEKRKEKRENIKRLLIIEKKWKKNIINNPIVKVCAINHNVPSIPHNIILYDILHI